MSLRTLIALESGLVEGQFIRNRGDIRQYHDLLRFIQMQTASKLDEELKREVHSYDRKEMQALLLKQAKLIEDLKTELEGAFMAMEDGEMRSITVIEKRMRYASKVISFLQTREASVCNYGQKLIERAEPFAKKFVIETLDWRSTPQDDVEWNHQLWKLENEFASIIGTAPTPGVAADMRVVDIPKVSNGIAEEVLTPNGVNWAPGETGEFDEKTGQAIPDRTLWKVSLGLLKLLKLLQLIHASTLKGFLCNGTRLTLASSTESARVVAHSLAVLDKIILADGEDSNIYISSVFSVLSTLLHSPLYISQFDHPKKDKEADATSKKRAPKSPPRGRGPPAPVESELPSVEWSWGADGYSDEFIQSRLLYWVLTMYHCRCYFVQKLGFYPMESQTSLASLDSGIQHVEHDSQDDGSVSVGELDDYTFVSFNRNEYHDLFLAGDYNGLFVLGSPTVLRIYRCVNASACAYLKTCGSFQKLHPPLQDLIRATLKLGLNSVQACVFRAKTVQGFNYADVALIEAVEGEVYEVIRLTTTVLANGILNKTILRLLKSIINLSKMRSSNFFLAVATVQCLRAALQCLLHLRNLPENIRYDADVKAKKRKKDIVRTPYADLVDMMGTQAAHDILYVTGTHPNSLTVQHAGLSALRMLLRPPFMSRVEIQDMFEDADEQEGDVVSEDEEEEEDGEDGDGTQAGGGNEFKKFRSKLWKSDLPEKVHDTFGYPTAPWSLTDSIMYCGETHMQSVEIVEQVLLVTQHLAQVSFMCRITLLERDIEKILNRIVETMPHNTYIMALVEVTLETLNWTD